MNNDKKTAGSKTYVFAWLSLLALTSATVTISGKALGMYGSLASVFIALIKSSLILLFFMHLKYEKLLLKILLIFVLIIIATIIGLTFFDVGYRYEGTHHDAGVIH